MRLLALVILFCLTGVAQAKLGDRFVFPEPEPRPFIINITIPDFDVVDKTRELDESIRKQSDEIQAILDADDLPLSN
jgi:hypothetical protein